MQKARKIMEPPLLVMWSGQIWPVDNQLKAANFWMAKIYRLHL